MKSTNMGEEKHTRFNMTSYISFLQLKIAIAVMLGSVAVASAQVVKATVIENSKTKSAVNSPRAHSEFRYQLVASINNTWGYDVFVDDRLTIRQITIPGLAGTAGFKTKSDAIKVAELVIKKMRRGEMPPVVNLKELKKLNVL